MKKQTNQEFDERFSRSLRQHGLLLPETDREIDTLCEQALASTQPLPEDLPTATEIIERGEVVRLRNTLESLTPGPTKVLMIAMADFMEVRNKLPESPFKHFIKEAMVNQLIDAHKILADGTDVELLHMAHTLNHWEMK